MSIFPEPSGPSWAPTLGVSVFIALLFAAGYTFWAVLALIAVVILFFGNLK